MNQITKRKNLMVTASLLLTITSMGFYSIYNQNGASALSISQTSGKVIAMNVEGIEGESLFVETDKWIDVISYSWGAEKADGAVGASRRRGGAILQDFVIVKNFDKSSPKLLEKTLLGEVIPKVEITEYINGNQVWSYELKNVMVTSFFVGGSSDFEGPDLEQVSFNFEEIKVTYTEYDETGKAMGISETLYRVETGDA